MNTPRTFTLILGGARSGKSTRALALARAHGGRVLFVATAEPGDAEMAVRIDAHRAERPPEWDTLEEPEDLASAIARVSHEYDVIIVDCLTLWVSNLMADARALPHIEDLKDRVATLLATYLEGNASWIVVSNEVGLGIVPASPLGRTYRDALGTVNRLVATEADIVTLMVAGLPVAVKG